MRAPAGDPSPSALRVTVRRYTGADARREHRRRLPTSPGLPADGAPELGEARDEIRQLVVRVEAARVREHPHGRSGDRLPLRPPPRGGPPGAGPPPAAAA